MYVVIATVLVTVPVVLAIVFGDRGERWMLDVEHWLSAHKRPLTFYPLDDPRRAGRRRRPVRARLIGMSGIVNWMVDLPTFVLFLLLALVGFGFTIGLSWLIRRFIEDDVRTKSSTSVTTVVGVIAGSLRGARDLRDRQRMADVQRRAGPRVGRSGRTHRRRRSTSPCSPEPTRTTIRDALVAYDRSVVCDEIPYLADHQGPNASTREALRKLYEAVATAPPAVREEKFYDNLVGQVAQVARARHDRINAASSPFPDLLLIVILVTSLALIAAASALDTQHRRWHLVLTTALTILVALNLTLILTLSRPFDGAATVSDSPLREGVPSALLSCGD